VQSDLTDGFITLFSTQVLKKLLSWLAELHKCFIGTGSMFTCTRELRGGQVDFKELVA